MLKRAAAFPLTMFSAATKTTQDVLATFQARCHLEGRLDFVTLREALGFNTCYAGPERYSG